MSPIEGQMLPRFLFVQVNDRCNLRCKHCLNWCLPPNPLPMTSEKRRDIIVEFAELSPGASVVICGGENMLALKDYFDVCSVARNCGLRCLSVVNGTMIQDPQMALRILVEGPDEISVSLDSHVEKLHDEMRGRKGSFEMAVKALRLLLKVRVENRLIDRKIRARVIILDENYLDLDALYGFVLRDIGADEMRINILQPSFGCSSSNNNFFASHISMDADRIIEQLRHCDAKYNLRLNPAWISQVAMYVKSVRRLPEQHRNWGATTDEAICDSGNRNIMVDLDGMASLCFGGGFRRQKLSLRGDLKKFWDEADSIRQSMSGCRRLCGIADCVRAESQILGGDMRFEGSGS